MPNTREKLFALLKDYKCEFQSCGECPHSNVKGACGNYVFNGMADHLIANGLTIQQWIPVEERLPQNTENVLIRSASGYIGSLTHFKDSGFRDCGMWVPVTHWMPLPEPPKGE